ncbi:MAG: hypothetical protein HXX80_07400 [Nitrososphaerales archaeon]|nr:hypothetical protein [Nitrososphaerales archaeon]
MELKISPDLSERFTGLQALIAHIRGIKVEKGSIELEDFKEKIIKEVKEKYDIESLKDVPILRAYRDFFWRVGIDPLRFDLLLRH